MKTVLEKSSRSDSLSPLHSLLRHGQESAEVVAAPLHEFPAKPLLPQVTCNQRQAEVNKATVTCWNGATTVQEHQDACQQPKRSGHAASPPSVSTPNTACSPRFSAFLINRQHRPTQLHLAGSNGFTAISVAELKQRICDTRIDAATIIQIPIDNRSPLPPTPTTPFTMGNKPSSISGSPAADDSSQRSVIRRSGKPVSRKSSFNVFKRIDSRSPLPREVTNSVMSILHHAPKKDKHEVAGEDDEALDDSSADPFLDQLEQGDSRYPDFGHHLHSASTITITEENAGRPLSASTTIRNRLSTEASWVDFSKDGSDKFDEAPSPSANRRVDLRSPTIPAPSPLPEDSPHKYGLRDKMDTPELPDKLQQVNITRPRRASSGVELFNVNPRSSLEKVKRLIDTQEVKNLQSAASFLNGLSTSRRRAESASEPRSTEMSISTYSGTTAAASRTSSTRPPSAGRTTSSNDCKGRHRGHNFKSSGFAYSRPLSFAQTSCYRKHEKLLPSKNKHAPVECAICHIDDASDHFTCSWCAVRMCAFCRKDFAVRGQAALRERIKTAEMGTADSANSSTASLD